MKIYMVARWVPLANPLDRGYRARFHTMGAFLDIENARAACLEANKNLLKHRNSEGWYTDHRYLHHVISYKVRDASPGWPSAEEMGKAIMRLQEIAPIHEER